MSQLLKILWDERNEEGATVPVCAGVGFTMMTPETTLCRPRSLEPAGILADIVSGVMAELFSHPALVVRKPSPYTMPSAEKLFEDRGRRPTRAPQVSPGTSCAGMFDCRPRLQWAPRRHQCGAQARGDRVMLQQRACNVMWRVVATACTSACAVGEQTMRDQDAAL